MPPLYRPNPQAQFPGMQGLLRFLLVVAFLAALLAHRAYAADSSGRFVVLGHGAVSCGIVVSAYEKDSYMRLAHSAWVLGYLTAINEEVFSGTDVSGNTDPEALSRWIYNYCKTNPLDSLRKATRELLIELLRRSK